MGLLMEEGGRVVWKEHQGAEKLSSLTPGLVVVEFGSLDCREEGCRVDQVLKQEVKEIFREGEFAND